MGKLLKFLRRLIPCIPSTRKKGYKNVMNSGLESLMIIPDVIDLGSQSFIINDEDQPLPTNSSSVIEQVFPTGWITFDTEDNDVNETSIEAKSQNYDAEDNYSVVSDKKEHYVKVEIEDLLTIWETEFEPKWIENRFRSSSLEDMKDIQDCFYLFFKHTRMHSL